MSTSTTSKIEDYLLYIIPVAVALAGFNWANLIPGDPNGFFTAIVFGFLAKLLIGVQQNGFGSWEDVIPTLVIVLGFLSTALSANPVYLSYGTVIGFVVKALGYFSDSTHPVEDLLLAVGAFLALYGVYTGNPTIQNAGALLALVGKTVPSLGTSPTSVHAPVPSSAPAAPT